MRQLFKFSLVSLAMILAVALCSNIFAQSSLLDFGPSNGSGTHYIKAPMAPVVFLDQIPNGVNGLFADASCVLCPSGQQTIADNFTATIVNGTTGILELVIWGGYYPEDIPNTTDDFTFIIHSDAGGQPGAVLTTLTGIQAASRVQTGVILFGTHEYKFTFDFSSNPIMVPSTGTYWLELFNNSVQSGNFYWETGNLDGTHGVLGSAWYTTTPGTAWNLDVATDLSAQINGDDNVTPCPIGAPTNPSPPNGATDIPLSGNTATWTNSSGTTMNEVYFDGNLVYDGVAITSLSLAGVEPFGYNTTHTWRVKCKDATCGTFGPTWSFTTIQDPNLVVVTVDIYPQNVNYWTGTCSPSAKTQVSLVNAMGTDVGWMVFDLSPIVNDPSTTINSIEFNGYLYNNIYPYWSITPMGSVNPITGDAATINSQVANNYFQGTAYSYNQESGTLPIGWIERDLETTAPADMKNALGQGWFAIGIVDFDFSPSYYVDFQGWAEANRPYLTVEYQYVIPVELTSFTAAVDFGVVELSWITATETNNQGFEVQRSAGGEFETIAFVEGHGTTTEIQAYSYTDKSVNVGSYSYRLKQIDFGGTFEYSNIVEVDVPAPAVFALDQNYPNPFNPSTKIAFRLAVDSKVSLKVFDVLGQEVATLVNTNLGAGGHNVDFNASSLNSGVYLYRIEATGIDGTNFVDVKKMILTK